MDMQNVSNLVIPEGEVRTIHDKNGNLLWGKVNYNVKYVGDTFQQTYTGKNLLYMPDGSFLNNQVTWTSDNNTATASGTAGSTSYSALTAFVSKTIPAGTYTFSIKDPVTKRVQFACRKDSSSPQVTNLIPIGSTSVTFTLNENMSQYHVVCLDAANADFTGFTISAMQLEAGSGATPFEPYVGGIPAPNPQYPQDIHTVTGEQNVTISDGNGNSYTYTVDLGAIKLVKIGGSQDYIYKSGDSWYLHKETATIANYAGESISTEYLSTTGQLTTGATVYYVLSAPTDTQITGSSLISQLDSIHRLLTRYGYGATVSGNLPLIIYKTNL